MVAVLEAVKVRLYRCLHARRAMYRGTSLSRISRPPQDHHRTLGMPYGRTLGGALFLMSEVPLYRIGVLRLQDHTHLGGHRGTSLIRKAPPVGLSGRPIPTCRTI